MTAIQEVRCPKCRYASGDSWGQCDGECPVPMSPHFSADAKQRYGGLRPLDEAELEDL